MSPVPVLVGALGIAQIISWGTLFYAIGVLGPAMRAELGVSELFLFGSFTAALLVAAFLSPLVGRMIDRHGGRAVLCAGSFTGAVALATVATATSPSVIALGWLLAGAAMAGCLYDPAFATLSQHTGARFRQAVSALTLFGGFASTVFWPVSQLCLESFGWRHTCAIYAALHLCVCLPVHWWLVPRGIGDAAPPRAAAMPDGGGPAAAGALGWLTASLALATFVFSVLAVHMIPLLTGAGLTAQEAVTVAMLFGPMQVLGRVIELAFARRTRAVATGFVPWAFMLFALAALIAARGLGVGAFAFVIAFGLGNGVLTIVKGTVPAELFGRRGFGALMGRLSRATIVAKALAPGAFSALVTFGATRNAALACLIGVAACGAVCYAFAVRDRPRSP
jgi:hypothetical protein